MGLSPATANRRLHAHPLCSNLRSRASFGVRVHAIGWSLISFHAETRNPAPNGVGLLRADARCAALWRAPETPWHAGRLPPSTRHNSLGNQEPVAIEPACQPPLKVGRLAGTLPVHPSHRLS